MPVHAQANGYQRARLRQTVREYLNSLEGGQRHVSPARRQQLIEMILERLVAQDLIQPQTLPTVQTLPRQAA
ncbi:hypothetical protein C5Y96_20915 [Blastopirellula marina]|uniref:Uncharacterized protein n=2 Tax=Pirellulales TaxID=2691354 RepID=A0A2S8F1A5_9BACT|nr:hypothetical protein C5Y96_20915 [Blastopirellula marina]RCS44277.1 hypothetical protein DTL36_20960 [Bremerella cremea]